FAVPPWPLVMADPTSVGVEAAASGAAGGAGAAAPAAAGAAEVAAGDAAAPAAAGAAEWSAGAWANAGTLVIINAQAPRTARMGVGRLLSSIFRQFLVGHSLKTRVVAREASLPYSDHARSDSNAISVSSRFRRVVPVF